MNFIQKLNKIFKGEKLPDSIETTAELNEALDTVIESHEAAESAMSAEFQALKTKQSETDGKVSDLENVNKSLSESLESAKSEIKSINEALSGFKKDLSDAALVMKEMKVKPSDSTPDVTGHIHVPVKQEIKEITVKTTV